MRRYKVGELIKINTLRTATEEGMCTARAAPNNCIIVTETVDMESYPSCQDFLGKKIECASGQLGTIVSYSGRPWKIRKSAQFSDYDVYGVLINGTVCDIFSVNLMPINSTVIG